MGVNNAYLVSMSKFKDLLPLKEARQQLARLMGLPADRIQIQEPGAGEGLEDAADFIVKIGSARYGVKFRSHADAASVGAVGGLKKLGHLRVPLVLVPYMGPVGRQACEEAGIG